MGLSRSQQSSKPGLGRHEPFLVLYNIVTHFSTIDQFPNSPCSVLCLIVIVKAIQAFAVALSGSAGLLHTYK